MPGLIRPTRTALPSTAAAVDNNNAEVDIVDGWSKHKDIYDNYTIVADPEEDPETIGGFASDVVSGSSV